MTETIKVGINGACGRMGQRIVALAHADPELDVFVALEDSSSPHLGEDIGEVCGLGQIGVAVTDKLDPHPDVIVDFSVPEGLMAILPQCADRQIALVIATTGLSESEKDEIGSAAQTTPIVWAPNMSLAVNLLMKLVREASRVLKQVPGGVDVEIIERHHRYKEDAPSGTALKFGEIIAAEMGQTEHVHGREGRIGPRPVSEIGYHALRTGDHVGEHTIVFGLLGETIDLTVRGQTRDSYAYGALMAAKYLFGKGAGMYSMDDVLGL